MVGKLRRLTGVTQLALQQLASLGNTCKIATLIKVCGTDEETLRVALSEAIQAGLIYTQNGACTFSHDSIQEAAYALIVEGDRASEHLRIGRLLASRTAAEELEESIFDIVNQFNRGAALITGREEREQVAQFNLLAALRAKAATAYASGLTYLVAGGRLLGGDIWERSPSLAFAIEFNRAECEYLTGEFAASEARLSKISSHARGVVDEAAVTCLRVLVHTSLDQNDRAIDVGREYLDGVGIRVPAHPTREEVDRDYELLWRRIGDRPIEALIDLPLMTAPDHLATMNVLSALVAPASFGDRHLRNIIVSRMAVLSLEHGNCDESSLAYVSLGFVLGPTFGDYASGLRFSQLGLDLVANRGLDHFKARVYQVFGNHVAPWVQHLPTCQPYLEWAFEAAQEVGDIAYAAYSRADLAANLVNSGEPLAEAEQQILNGLSFARKAKFRLVADGIGFWLSLIRCLQGRTSAFGCLSDSEFDEEKFELQLESDPQRAKSAGAYWIRKLQARFFADDYRAALAAAARAATVLWAMPTDFESAEYHFCAGVARAALCDVTSPNELSRDLVVLHAHRDKLTLWAGNCPQNFSCRAALIDAEIARLEGRELEAQGLYEQSIRLSNEHRFLQIEGVANEVTARFYASRGFMTIADAYRRQSRICYFRWGAEGKVRQFDLMYPHLSEKPPRAGAIITAARGDQLDLAYVVEMSQAISGEILLDGLIERLMVVTVKHAGAVRALLLLPRDEEMHIVAEATTNQDMVEVRLCDVSDVAEALPESMLRYVTRSRESVLLDDALQPNAYSTDPFVTRSRPRSVVCLPLIKQARLVGVLYLENNVSPYAFTRERLDVLRILASQAAISLENTRLYRDLEQREAKIRGLVDANIIGICVGSSDGRMIEANDAYLRIVGYDREDLRSGRISWTDLTPPEWRDRSAEAFAKATMTGAAQPYEKEYFRKDGSRVPVLVGVAGIEGIQHQSVSFVLDLTERKRAEAEARESRQRFREVQLELEHANRVATIGQLSASIAHEVNQPIASAVTNAQTAMRWLEAEPPNLHKAKQALARILENANRAAEVISGIRALVKKEPPRQDRLEINETIMEVIAMTRGEVLRNEVSVRTRFKQGLPRVQGDRVQLQQVILNLIINAAEAMTGVSDGKRELLISTGDSGPEDIIVAVADSGPGLGTVSSERLFDAFYTTKPTGLGMGLAICRTIVEAHGGRLFASANAPRGAIFQFTVPVLTPAENLLGHFSDK